MCIECEKCGEDIPLNDDTFKCESSGTDSNPTEGIVHWFEGVLTCSSCGHEHQYSDST